MKITIIDSIMGSGKTSWAIQQMNHSHTERYIFCSAFSDEIEKVKTDCPDLHFHEAAYKPDEELAELHKLIKNGQNIVTLHKVFAHANKETVELLNNSDYILMLDGSFDICHDFNDCSPEESFPLDVFDLAGKMREKKISLDENRYVKWEAEMPERYNLWANFAKLANDGTLLCPINPTVAWEFPHEVFAKFKQVYIMDYMFDATMMAIYLKYHGFRYEKKSVTFDGGQFILTKYTEDFKKRRDIALNVEICQHKKMNAYSHPALGKLWFSQRKVYDEQTRKLKNNIFNFCYHLADAKSEEVMWTAQTDNYRAFAPDGCVWARQQLTKSDGMNYNDRNHAQQTRMCFTPFNENAFVMMPCRWKWSGQPRSDEWSWLDDGHTVWQNGDYSKTITTKRTKEDYADRRCLIYAASTSCDKPIAERYQSRIDADGRGIKLDEAMFALRHLLLWMWQSRIHNNEPIVIYIPSARMRKLLIKWLGCEI